MSPLTGEKCSDYALTLNALGQILECSVQGLCEWIEFGESGLTKFEQEQRTWAAAMLNKVPNTCTAMRDRMRNDSRYTAVMFYERTRLGAAASGHFLEGLATGLPLFTGATAVVLKDEDIKKLRLRDVVADRIKTVSSLELLKNDSERLQKLVEDYTLSDLPPGLPGRIHVFISRMRAICQGLQRVKPETSFKQCKNCECNRKFYMGTPTELGPELKLYGKPNLSCGSNANGNHGHSSTDAYWDLAAGEPELRHEQREFCTWSCCMQWRWQLGQAMPTMTACVMIADYQCVKIGRARVPEALRACGKRNEVASRHFRSIQKDRRVFSAVSSRDLRLQRERRIRMLNVDLGILYASSILAESKALSSNKVLPGASEGWRSRPVFYAKAVKSVMGIYNKHHVGGNVVSNLLVNEPFLVKLKEKASKVF